MKFEDLVFKPHTVDSTGTHCVVSFENGYGASIVTGRMFYTSAEKPYELAILKNGSLCYDTEITSDVLGWLEEEDVISYLDKIEKLSRPDEL